MDATLTAAPPSTQDLAQARDPDMSQTQKGNQWPFGMKLHIGTDPRGVVHTAVATTTSVHGSQVLEGCLHGVERAIHGDCTRRGVRWRVAKKAQRSQSLSDQRSDVQSPAQRGTCSR